MVNSVYLHTETEWSPATHQDSDKLCQHMRGRRSQRSIHTVDLTCRKHKQTTPIYGIRSDDRAYPRWAPGVLACSVSWSGCKQGTFSLWTFTKLYIYDVHLSGWGHASIKRCKPGRENGSHTDPRTWFFLQSSRQEEIISSATAEGETLVGPAGTQPSDDRFQQRPYGVCGWVGR